VFGTKYSNKIEWPPLQSPTRADSAARR
jgi:hypothetical protein